MEKDEKAPRRRHRLRELSYTFFFCLFLGGVLIFLVFIGMLFNATIRQSKGIDGILANMACWFDPIFTQYNLLLLLVAVLIAPLITVFYVYRMHNEKLRRLQAELPEAVWSRHKSYITSRISYAFRLQNFIGGMSILTIVILLGCGIILLLKPLPISKQGCGVDYSLGANFLLLGPSMEDFITAKEGKAFIHVVMTSLTGFLFGFLGAYIYFVIRFVRSYFMLDLTPHTFVICSVRIVTGAILALVLSFFLTDLLKDQPGLLPVIAFFIGFFPSRGLILIEKISLSVLKLGAIEYASTPLSQLPGMSYAHELRLDYEGFDNIENLTDADPLELCLRTGFSFRQLQTWISQARLATHFGPDYRDFFKSTGIESIHSLNEFFRKWNRPEDPCGVLDEATGSRMKGKILALSALLGPEPDKKVERTA